MLIACGGTGGHLFPGIAVGEVLASRGHDVTLLISEKKIDTLAASGHPELRFEKMPFLAMPKPWSPKMFGFLKGLWKRHQRPTGRSSETMMWMWCWAWAGSRPLPRCMPGAKRAATR